MSGGYSVAVCGLLIAVVLLLWSMGSRSTGSVVVARGLSSCGLRALERRLSSCGARAYLLCGMWDLPGPGLEPVSPALTGGFLTTVPPGKTLLYIIYLLVFVNVGFNFSKGMVATWLKSMKSPGKKKVTFS